MGRGTDYRLLFDFKLAEKYFMGLLFGGEKLSVSVSVGREVFLCIAVGRRLSVAV